MLRPVLGEDLDDDDHDHAEQGYRQSARHCAAGVKIRTRSYHLQENKHSYKY